jgi:hypothetical protein
MQVVLASIIMSITLAVMAHASPINLPGTLAGGVQVCSPYNCLTTAGNRETPVRVLSYQDGLANVRIGNETMVADPNHIVLELKRCRLSLRSYLAKRFCPGWKP